MTLGGCTVLLHQNPATGDELRVQHSKTLVRKHTHSWNRLVCQSESPCKKSWKLRLFVLQLKNIHVKCLQYGPIIKKVEKKSKTWKTSKLICTYVRKPVWLERERETREGLRMVLLSLLQDHWSLMTHGIFSLLCNLSKESAQQFLLLPPCESFSETWLCVVIKQT